MTGAVRRCGARWGPLQKQKHVHAGVKSVEHLRTPTNKQKQKAHTRMHDHPPTPVVFSCGTRLSPLRCASEPVVIPFQLATGKKNVYSLYGMHRSEKMKDLEIGLLIVQTEEAIIWWNILRATAIIELYHRHIVGIYTQVQACCWNRYTYVFITPISIGDHALPDTTVDASIFLQHSRHPCRTTVVSETSRPCLTDNFVRWHRKKPTHHRNNGGTINSVQQYVTTPSQNANTAKANPRNVA